MKITTSSLIEIIVGILILARIYKGYQRGFINTAIPFVSLFLAICFTKTLVRPAAAIIAPFLGNEIGELRSMVAARPLNQIKLLIAMMKGKETAYPQMVASFNAMFSYWMTYGVVFVGIVAVSGSFLHRGNTLAQSPMGKQINRILGSAIEIVKSIGGIWVCYALLVGGTQFGFAFGNGLLQILNQSLILSYINQFNPLFS